MNESGMRAALLAAEPPSAELEGRYRERLRVITERRMSGGLRAAHAVGMLIALVTAVRCVILAAQSWGKLAPVGLVALGLAFAFSAGWAIATAAALRAGADRVFTNNAVRAWLVVAFAFLVATLMTWVGLTTHEVTQGLRYILFGLTFWCAAGLPFLVYQLVSEATARTRLDLLRLELAVAERGAGTEVRS